MSDKTCYVIAVNLLHRWQCFLLTRWRRLLRLSSWVNWACLLPECVKFMSSAVLVTLRFKRIASIRVIGKPYALQNGASICWPAACRLHTPQFCIMEIFNCDKYAMCQCQIGIICYGLAIGQGLRIMYRV